MSAARENCLWECTCAGLCSKTGNFGKAAIWNASGGAEHAVRGGEAGPGSMADPWREVEGDDRGSVPKSGGD